MALPWLNWSTLSKALFIEGLFFLGLSAGWAFGHRVDFETTKQAVIVLMGISFFSLLVSVSIFALKTRADIKNEVKFFRAIDLNESFRALRAYGRQPPLFQNASLKSVALACDGKTLLDLPAAFEQGELLIEHWDGPDIKVTKEGQGHLLAKNSLIRLPFRSNEVLYVEPQNSGYSHLVLHFFSSASTLE